MNTLAAAPLCIGPQALVCGGVLLALTVGTVAVGVMMTSDGINNADRAADDDLDATGTTRACESCENPCEHLACGSPNSQFRGGAHGCMTQPTGDGKDSHHMPARSISPLDPDMGPAIQMDPRDHRRTNSYGRSPNSNDILAGQQDQIAAGNFVAAQAIDIAEVEALFPGKYEEAIAQMMAYTACLRQNGLI